MEVMPAEFGWIAVPLKSRIKPGPCAEELDQTWNEPTENLAKSELPPIWLGVPRFS
jgi:hypothetical protein